MKNDLIELLKSHQIEFRSMGIKSLIVFGSVARNTTTAKSDVDILVSFTSSATFDQYMELKFYLEDLLKRPVDLVTENGLRPELRPYIEQDMIRVA